VSAAQRYLAGMERNDGKGDYSFFHPECNRIEHGLQTTNVKSPTPYGHSDDVEFSSLTAEEQWKTGFLAVPSWLSRADAMFSLVEVGICGIAV
jgi:hypothetical protein